jgi:hypothetical protein
MIQLLESADRQPVCKYYNTLCTSRDPPVDPATGPMDWRGCSCEQGDVPEQSDAATRKTCGEHNHECEHLVAPAGAEVSGSASSYESQSEWRPPVTLSSATDKPAKGRKPSTKIASCKPQRVCMYEHCPSPMHSSKWRVITSTAVAGGRDWQPLHGMTLCDSCYSTYRKHGTFIRSVRTAEGWARFDHAAQTHVLNKPSKKRVMPTPRPVKRARSSPSEAEGVSVSVKRRDWRVTIDEVASLDALQEGRPKRERKPSAKLRDVLGGPECDDYSLHEDADHDSPSTNQLQKPQDVETPSTTCQGDVDQHCEWPQEYSHPYGGDGEEEEERTTCEEGGDSSSSSPDDETYEQAGFLFPLLCTYSAPVHLPPHLPPHLSDLVEPGEPNSDSNSFLF